MNLKSHSHRREQGSTLIITAILAVIAGSMLVYYLRTSQQEYSMVNRSEGWNSAMILAEAGIEEGLTLVNNNNWPNNPTLHQADGWTINGNVYSITRSLGEKLGSYTVYVTNTSMVPIIRSTGTAYTQNASYVSNNISRTVVVQAINTSPFPGALTLQQGVDMNGNNVTVDSYDSTDPYHSYWPYYPGGRGYGTYINYGSSSVYPYTSNYRKANGDVATDGAVTGVISIGNGQVYGHVNTGPGGTAQIGKQGSVGSTSWVPTQGIQTGYARDDMNVTFSDVNAPSATSWTSVSAGATITNAGYYKIDQIYQTSLTIAASNVVLYVPNGINVKGSALTITTNAYVTMYVGGSITDGGNGVINNASQHPIQLIIYGITTGSNPLTSITLNGNGAFWGAIYAPLAVVNFKGAGNSGGYYGALTGYSIDMTGNSTFSYDESLGRFGSTGYKVTSWQEVQ